MDDSGAIRNLILNGPRSVGNGVIKSSLQPLYLMTARSSNPASPPPMSGPTMGTIA
jgi:hypothetical protein